MDALRKPPFSFDVVITQKDLFPRDPNLIYYPLIYIHGRAALSFRPGGPRRPAPTPRARRRHALRRRRLRQPRLRRRVPPVRRRAAPQQPPGSDSPRRRALHQQGRRRPVQTSSTPRPPAAAAISPSSKGSRSTTTGRSSTPSTTSAAPSSATPASSARAIRTRARSRSPAISSCTRRCREVVHGSVERQDIRRIIDVLSVAGRPAIVLWYGLQERRVPEPKSARVGIARAYFRRSSRRQAGTPDLQQRSDCGSTWLSHLLDHRR